MSARASAGKAARAKPATVYSTSEARANFAEALEAAGKNGAVIGFDRYGRTVAALVPLEAIYMLAGKGAQLSPATRDDIERAARNLVQDILQPENQMAQLKREPVRAKSASQRAAPAKRKRGSKS